MLKLNIFSKQECPFFLCIYYTIFRLFFNLFVYTIAQNRLYIYGLDFICIEK